LIDLAKESLADVVWALVVEITCRPVVVAVAAVVAGVDGFPEPCRIFWKNPGFARYSSQSSLVV
jgi:hypothetical protein